MCAISFNDYASRCHVTSQSMPLPRPRGVSFGPQTPAGAAAAATPAAGGAAGSQAATYSTAPVAISGGRSMAAGAAGPGGLSDAAELSDMEIYSRSLAYVPPSPNIPAPFR